MDAEVMFQMGQKALWGQKSMTIEFIPYFQQSRICRIYNSWINIWAALKQRVQTSIFILFIISSIPSPKLVFL